MILKSVRLRRKATQARENILPTEGNDLLLYRDVTKWWRFDELRIAGGFL